MKVIKINEIIDLENALFHHHPKKFFEYVDENGIPAAIGENAIGVEKNPKIFFSKGIDGMLKLWDVWIKWEMKHAFDGKNKYDIFDSPKEKDTWQKYWDANFPTNANYEQIKNFFENFPKEQKEKFYDAFIPKMIEEYDYYLLDIKDGVEYDSNDIDEGKQKLKDEFDSINPNDYPHKFEAIKETNKAKALYGSFSRQDLITDDWNMHTKPYTDVSKDKITQVTTSDGKTDALSILIEMYDKRKTMPNSESLYSQFDILPDFIDYAKNKRLTEHLQQVQEELQKAHKIKNSLELLKNQQLIEANSNQTYATQQNNLQSPVNQAPTQTNGKQKTLGVHPATKQNNSNPNSAISTFIITFGILISGLAAIYLNLLV